MSTSCLNVGQPQHHCISSCHSCPAALPFITGAFRRPSFLGPLHSTHRKAAFEEEEDHVCLSHKSRLCSIENARCHRGNTSGQRCLGWGNSSGKHDLPFDPSRCFCWSRSCGRNIFIVCNHQAIQASNTRPRSKQLLGLMSRAVTQPSTSTNRPTVSIVQQAHGLSPPSG